MFDEKHRFIIQDYQKRSPFSSFLPGIAGPTGIPLWCYYNNRGQAVCSFGVQDKDHAIMEFSPAHVAYREVSRTGFRTFCKLDGRYRELFADHCDMYIGMSELELVCQTEGLTASALYYGVPGERAAALARVLTVKNSAAKPLHLELLDGMPALVPYGVNQDALKNMTQLAKAWMQVEDAEQGNAYFRVRASMADTACVTSVEGGNFSLAFDEKGRKLKPLVQPSLIFGEDTALAEAVSFRESPLSVLCAAPQVTQNQFPCCFFAREAVLLPGEEVRIYSLYGQVENKAEAARFREGITDTDWFAGKRKEASELVETLCSVIQTKTADPIFDAYCKQSYLDNLLRGGAPVCFCHEGKSKPFYLYSRKHGDPEREYNYFSLGREYYAQGNGNFRDVNQNRRSDVLFVPQVEAENIHTFFDLIQTDGYNPLVITPATYTLPQKEVPGLLWLLPEDAAEQARRLLAEAFRPGTLAMAAESWGLSKEAAGAFTAAAVCAAESEPNAEFSEGYWCDHWTYNLDLIESYLAVYPERKEELLFADCRYRYYETQVKVNPRVKRYCMTANGLRQYTALDEEAKEHSAYKWMRTRDGKEARSTLAEKLLLLCALKTATLDPAGMGIEMEGGKPGWYDALNGLPGLFGSSMAESCELARLLAFTARALEESQQELLLYEEIEQLLGAVDEILSSEEDPFTRWDRLNSCKEAYREQTLYGYCGNKTRLSGRTAAAMLRSMERVVMQGIRTAVESNGGICPTYFIFKADGVRQTPDGWMPAMLIPEALPLFLEGPVRWLKLDTAPEEKRQLARKVRGSALYDEKLHMYKVNASLAAVSFEAGRAKAFTPGWLENESIWLHMEYKYLLELLKSGLYDEFGAAFREAAVPFLDAESYGRSPLENVSFLASSANPDPETHGKGYVARLSGSTAEFLQMWQIMFFGRQPFRLADGALRLELSPYIPAYLLPEDGRVEAVFLGQTPVTYVAEGCAELIPGRTEAVRYELRYSEGETEVICGAFLPERQALAIREGQVKSVRVTMKERNR